MILEASRYPNGHVTFITLTYDPENLPDGGTLVKEDFTNFVKRLKYHTRDKFVTAGLSESQNGFRYFGVGEYGDRFGRPHYHLVVFGVPMEDMQMAIRHAWTKGHTDVGLAEPGAFKYVANYVQKKLNGDMAEKEYAGKEHPFAQMSRMPGIGSHVTDQIVEKLKKTQQHPKNAKFGNQIFEWYGGKLRINGYTYSLPDYCLQKIMRAFELEFDQDKKRWEGHIEWLKELYNLDDNMVRRGELARKVNERGELAKMKATH